MFNPQTAKLIARIAENLPHLDATTMQGWIENPKGLRTFLKGLTPPSNVLLDLVDTFNLEAQSCFYPAEKFVNSHMINIFSRDFMRLLLKPEKENNIPLTTIQTFQLSRQAYDEEILARFGEDIDIGRSHLYYFLEKYYGEDHGSLYKDGKANVFYIRDDQNILCAVDAKWNQSQKRWHLRRSPVTETSYWKVGYRILVRS